MKRILSIICVFALLFSFAACTETEEEKKEKETNSIVSEILKDEVPEIEITYGEFSFEEDKKTYKKDAPGYNDYDLKNTLPYTNVDKNLAYELAIKELKIVCDRVKVDYDKSTKMWRVTFISEEMYKATQKIYMNEKGVTVLSVTETK